MCALFIVEVIFTSQFPLGKRFPQRCVFTFNCKVRYIPHFQKTFLFKTSPGMFYYSVSLYACTIALYVCTTALILQCGRQPLVESTAMKQYNTVQLMPPCMVRVHEWHNTDCHIASKVYESSPISGQPTVCPACTKPRCGAG